MISKKRNNFFLIIFLIYDLKIFILACLFNSQYSSNELDLIFPPLLKKEESGVEFKSQTPTLF